MNSARFSRPKNRVTRRTPRSASSTAVRTLTHPLRVLVLQPERPHGVGTADRVEQLLLLDTDGDPLRRVERLRPCRTYQRTVCSLDRHGEQGREEKPPVEHRHGHQRQHDRQHRPAQLRQRLAHGLGDHRDVVGHARGEVARTGLLDLFQRQAQGAVDEPLAQMGQHASRRARAISESPRRWRCPARPRRAPATPTGGVSAVAGRCSVTRSTTWPSSGAVSSPTWWLRPWRSEARRGDAARCGREQFADGGAGTGRGSRVPRSSRSSGVGSGGSASGGPPWWSRLGPRYRRGRTGPPPIGGWRRRGRRAGPCR